MDTLSISGVKIAGIVACLPENTLDNRVACADLYGDTVGTLIKATGIEGRCIANKGTTALDLNVAAANELLKDTGIAPEDVGGVICVTFTPEYLMPADAPAAQARLGLKNDCVAFDINMACSGYGYGMYITSTFVRATRKPFLLLDGDVQSAYVFAEDKATMPVMADVGTATLIIPSEDESEWKFSFYTDGSRREALYIKVGGSKNLITKADLEPIEYPDGSKRRDIDIFMDGYEIFRFVAIDATKVIKQFMDINCIEPDKLDAFVPHQANIYMIQQVAKKLKIDKSKMWKSGDVYGNPASASVPLTIAHNADRWFTENQTASASTLFSGFGGGLSISIGSITLNRNAAYKIIHISDNNTNI